MDFIQHPDVINTMPNLDDVIALFET
jgi:hypothetical protein